MICASASSTRSLSFLSGPRPTEAGHVSTDGADTGEGTSGAPPSSRSSPFSSRRPWASSLVEALCTARGSSCRTSRELRRTPSSPALTCPYYIATRSRALCALFEGTPAELALCLPQVRHDRVDHWDCVVELYNLGQCTRRRM